MRVKKRVAAIAFQMAVLASAGLLSLIEQARSYTDHPIEGGKGGNDFTVICPPNSFLLGLSGNTGGIIEKMQLICAPFTPATPAASRTNFSVGQRFDQGAWIGAGTGGSSARSTCTTGTGFVKEIRFNTAVFNDARAIEHIRLECGDLQDHASTHLFGKNETQGGHRQRCQGNEFLVGFRGRVGLYVDAIGAVCAGMP
jgi:hypothetical protein